MTKKTKNKITDGSLFRVVVLRPATVTVFSLVRLMMIHFPSDNTVYLFYWSFTDTK